MTERYGPGDGEEGAQRPSGRGAVTERLARQDHVNEIDLTDETAERESSGAFEPAPPVASADPAGDPPAGEDARTGASNIFDVDERAKDEEQNRTGYEPSVADPDSHPDGPRGETVVTEPGENRDEPDPAPDATPGALLGSLDAGGVRNRFLDIQAGFIDEPRQAVEEAGRFVDDLLRQVADALQRQRGQLAGATDEASTEDLRLALRAYRQFVDRLLGLAS
jgi:hypothetical protein